MTTEKPKNEILTTKYLSNGNKWYEESILEVEGELLLCKTFWYEDGQKQTEILFSEDKEEGERNVIISEISWNESGLELEKYLRHKPYKKDYAIGDTVGYKKQTEYYTNDQKRSEWNWKIVFSDKDLEGAIIDPELDKHLKKHPKKQYVEDGKRTSWYENGQKKNDSFYKDDKMEGKFTSWYEDGQKITESNHKNDEYDGNWTSWYEDGQKVSEGKYINGKKEGKWTEWDESGKITVQENYKDGELID